MKRVTGIGGVFFKTKDPKQTKAWYAKHLGISSNEYGGAFVWRPYEHPDDKAMTAWSPFDAKTDYFEPSSAPFMFNYRVENLEALLSVLAEEGVQVVGEMQVFEYGKFAWIMDLDGNKIELWEPIDGPLDGTVPETF